VEAQSRFERDSWTFYGVIKYFKNNTEKQGEQGLKEGHPANGFSQIFHRLKAKASANVLRDNA
jgi:hypothetical protein